MVALVLQLHDGGELAFEGDPERTVLEAAEAAGLYLPAMCREGTCGACLAEVREGDYRLDPPAVKGTGPVPLCRCHPQGDLRMEAPYGDAAVLRHAVPVREGEIVALTPAGAGAMAVDVRLAGDAAADFLPGQYMEVGVPGTTLRRAYSLANLPNWEGRLAFLIRLQPGGAFSTWLATEARPGSRLSLRGPLGHFLLDETSIRPRCMIGGGCGFAPILAMLRQLAEMGDTLPTTLIFAVNRESELFAEAEIAELQAALPDLRVVRAVWRPEGAWDGFTGTAAEALAALLASVAEQPDIYVCGPPAMLAAVTEVAVARGVTAEHIFAEQVVAR